VKRTRWRRRRGRRGALSHPSGRLLPEKAHVLPCPTLACRSLVLSPKCKRPDPGPPRARSGRAGALSVALSLAAASPGIAEAFVAWASLSQRNATSYADRRAAAAVPLPGRCGTLAPPMDRSVPPLAKTRALASTRGAAWTSSTRLPLLVQRSSARTSPGASSQTTAFVRRASASGRLHCHGESCRSAGVRAPASATERRLTRSEPPLLRAVGGWRPRARRGAAAPMRNSRRCGL
jgi:hypothetical protein